VANWLPWALLVFIAVVLAAMPWRRPHPNHEFMLHMLRLLEEDAAKVANCSSSIGRPATTNAEYRPASPDMH
jgi:hypothetical protein